MIGGVYRGQVRWPLAPVLRANGDFSLWDHLRILGRIGDAYRVLKNFSKADEMIAKALELHREKGLAVCGMGRLDLFADVLSRHTGDQLFQFSLLDPSDLDKKCWRSSEESKPLVFNRLSRELMTRIETWCRNFRQDGSRKSKRCLLTEGSAPARDADFVAYTAISFEQR